MSLDEHIEMAMSALTLFGLGIGCETEYMALLVIAEAARLLHNHGVFDPRPKAEELAKSARELLAKMTEERGQREALSKEAAKAFAAPDNGQVH